LEFNQFVRFGFDFVKGINKEFQVAWMERNLVLDAPHRLWAHFGRHPQRKLIRNLGQLGIEEFRLKCPLGCESILK